MLGTLSLLLVVILLIVGAIFLIRFNYQSPKNHKETEEVINLEEEQEWFSQGRWLTDKEIDWAGERIEKDKRFKILPAYQFHLVRESQKWSKEEELFTYLLSELTGANVELVFIPVNKTNFHWSLLVFETKSKVFYHHDTLGGANYGYVEPLVKELLEQIHGKKVELEKFLIKQHDIRKNNGYDCGVAVIAIMRRIIELKFKQSWKDRLKYGKFRLGDDLGGFDFAEERESLRTKYLQENN